MSAPAVISFRAEASFVRMGTLFVGYTLVYAGASYLTNEFVITESFLEEEWSTTFDDARVVSMIEQRSKWMLLSYGTIPIVLLLKIIFPALCLATGCAFVGWSFRFRDVVHVCVRAEIVFALAAVVHLTWTLVGPGFGSVAEFVAFYPLSALHFVEIDESHMWMVYPLKTLNAFEAAYATTLALGMRHSLNKTLRSAVALVVFSYGTGLLLLVCAVTFLHLYFA